MTTPPGYTPDEAKWHKSCYNKFGMKRLDRAKRKRKQADIKSKSIDGTVLVHLLSTASIRIFDEYADCVFLPHLVKQLEKCTRLDVLWDTYIADNIKVSAREKRVQGIQRKVAGKNMVPTNWKGFLRDEKISRNYLTFSPTRLQDSNTLRIRKSLLPKVKIS